MQDGEVSYYPIKIMKVELIGEVIFNLDALDEDELEKFTDEEMSNDFLPAIKEQFDRIISIKTSFRNEGDGNGKEEN